MNWLPAQLMLFIFKMIIVTIFCIAISPLVGDFLGGITGSPIFNGLAVIGGMLPAIGIALNLRAILKKETWPFLLIGFLLVAYFKLSIIGVALFGVAFAMIYILWNKKKEEA